MHTCWKQPNLQLHVHNLCLTSSKAVSLFFVRSAHWKLWPTCVLLSISCLCCCCCRCDFDLLFLTAVWWLGGTVEENKEINKIRNMSSQLCVLTLSYLFSFRYRQSASANRMYITALWCMSNLIQWIQKQWKLTCSQQVNSWEQVNKSWVNTS